MAAWNAETVVALAPDSQVLTAAQRLSAQHHWSQTGRTSGLVWGVCRGSGHWQVVGQLEPFAFHCTCPSRKRPCKHVMGLLLLAGECPDAVVSQSPPPWVEAWLKRREAAAQRRRVAPPGQVADPKAQAARLARRDARVERGLAVFRQWLEDLVRSGLASFETRWGEICQAQAARLVDAQAGSLAGRVRRLADMPTVGSDAWRQVLARLGRFALVVQAHGRLPELPAPLQADVRQYLGWQVTQADLQAHGDTVTDQWCVLGQVIDDDERLRMQRSWLWGKTSRRWALILQFAPRQGAFDEHLQPGTVVPATLWFYPGAVPLRARVGQRTGEETPFTEPPPALDTIDAQLAWMAERWAQQPLLEALPCALAEVVVAPDGAGRWHAIDRQGSALPLRGVAPWNLLAAGGGRPLWLFGEWDGGGVWPLGAWAEGEFISSTDLVGDGPITLLAPVPQRSAIDEQLLRLAMIGTAQVPGPPPSIPTLEEVLPGLPQGTSTEWRLLLAIGAWDVYRTAGYVPNRVEAPPPAAEETAARVSMHMARLAIGDDSPLLAREVCRRMALARRILPPVVLPAVLNMTDRQRRQLLQPALGQRGVWLAQFLPAWRWALPKPPAEDAKVAEALWQEGDLQQRCDLLRQMRRADPALARDWLTEVWSQEPARHRQELLQVLEENLTAADIEFLQRALADRSAAVRAVAARWLLRIEDAPLRREVAQAAEACLHVARQRGQMKLQVHPPDDEARWEQIGLLRGAPDGGDRPQRTVWALVAAVAPPHWEQQFEAQPAALLAAIGAQPWADVLRDAWTVAALEHAAEGWLGPLWDAHWQALVQRRRRSGRIDLNRRQCELLAELWRRMPAEEVSPRAVAALDENAPCWLPDIEKCFAALPLPWPAEVARAVISGARQYLQRVIDGRDEAAITDVWQPLVHLAGHAMPEELFIQVREPWLVPDRGPAEQVWSMTLHGLARVLIARLGIAQEIPID